MLCLLLRYLQYISHVQYEATLNYPFHYVLWSFCRNNSEEPWADGPSDQEPGDRFGNIPPCTKWQGPVCGEDDHILLCTCIFDMILQHTPIKSIDLVTINHEVNVFLRYKGIGSLFLNTMSPQFCEHCPGAIWEAGSDAQEYGEAI